MLSSCSMSTGCRKCNKCMLLKHPVLQNVVFEETMRDAVQEACSGRKVTAGALSLCHSCLDYASDHVEPATIHGLIPGAVLFGATVPEWPGCSACPCKLFSHSIVNTGSFNDDVACRLFSVFRDDMTDSGSAFDVLDLCFTCAHSVGLHHLSKHLRKNSPFKDLSRPSTVLSSYAPTESTVLSSSHPSDTAHSIRESDFGNNTDFGQRLRGMPIDRTSSRGSQHMSDELSSSSVSSGSSARSGDSTSTLTDATVSDLLVDVTTHWQPWWKQVPSGCSYEDGFPARLGNDSSNGSSYGSEASTVKQWTLSHTSSPQVGGSGRCTCGMARGDQPPFAAPLCSSPRCRCVKNSSVCSSLCRCQCGSAKGRVRELERLNPTQSFVCKRYLA